MNQSPLGEETNNSEVNWKIDYNTQNKYVDLEITKNNETQHLKFDKNDISKILNTRSVNKPIHERLLDDNSSLFPSIALNQYNVGDEVSTIEKLENELGYLYQNKSAIINAVENATHTGSIFNNDVNIPNHTGSIVNNDVNIPSNIQSFKRLTKKVRKQQTKKKVPSKRKRILSKRKPKRILSKRKPKRILSKRKRTPK